MPTITTPLKAEDYEFHRIPCIELVDISTVNFYIPESKESKWVTHPNTSFKSLNPYNLQLGSGRVHLQTGNQLKQSSILACVLNLFGLPGWETTKDLEFPTAKSFQMLVQEL